MSQAIMSLDSISKNPEMKYDGYNSQTKLLLVNLPRKAPFWLRAIWVQFGFNLFKPMSHDSLSEDLFEVLWHHEVQKIVKISLIHFSKNLLLGQYQPNLKPSVLGFALCGFFFKCCSMKIHSRYTMVTVSFTKISLLCQNGQFGTNLDKNYATLFCNLEP